MEEAKLPGGKLNVLQDWLVACIQATWGRFPDWLPNRENTDKGFVGLSTFALPKWLRNALRCGTGLEDIDLVSCHFQMQVRRHRGLDIPCTKKLVNDKHSVLEEIAQTPWAKGGEDPKTMLITILYGHPAPKNAGEWVGDFEKEHNMIKGIGKETIRRYSRHVQADETHLQPWNITSISTRKGSA